MSDGGASSRGTSSRGGLSLDTAEGRWVLLATVLGSALAGIDATVVNVALPAIGADLGGGFTSLQWTVSAYALTLASFIQAEARQVQEMPVISGVYHRRLDLGWLLQADPTVLYALGGPRDRLLFAAIDSVADSPYNTYTQGGLPPGPIGAPGDLAISAALQPEGDFLFFVARPDGSHVFTRSLADHNRAVAESRRLRRLDTGNR